jgi:hypothetical protein
MASEAPLTRFMEHWVNVDPKRLARSRRYLAAHLVQFTLARRPNGEAMCGDCLWFRGGSLQNSRSMGPCRSITFHESNHRVTQFGNLQSNHRPHHHKFDGRKCYRVLGRSGNLVLARARRARLVARPNIP